MYGTNINNKGKEKNETTSKIKPAFFLLCINETHKSKTDKGKICATEISQDEH